MIDLEKIKARVLSGENLEKILESFDWNEFEQAIAEIFASNSFHIIRNFRFKTNKTNKRHEIDIVAVRGSAALCVDCKHWSGGRYKQSSLKRAVAMQKERTKKFKNFLRKNIIAHAKLKLGGKVGSKPKFYPLIVTLLEEELKKFEGCIIVPVWKLNSFLIDMEKYIN